MVKVTVIVPVYNPGSHIDQCVSSLLGQSLPDDEYEAIFVDDGSTDGTSERLDELASRAPNVRVEHIPNSGWPGRPRNIGIDLARGEFVYFVDNDDWLGRSALERLYGTAVRYGSDIVIGKVVGHGKVVSKPLFERNRKEARLEWPPLMGLLTPHKLFRKSLLTAHGIRFPEGRRRLEDHAFVVHAYFHAGRISVLASYPCYHWTLRDPDLNASWQQLDPVGYYDNVREVLDLVVEHTEPGALRDRLCAYWYRTKMLGRVGGGSFLNREPEYRRALYEEVRRLALERYGPEVEAFLAFNRRIRSELLRRGSYEGLGLLAAFEDGLRADVKVRRARREDGALMIELEAAIDGEPEPLTLVRRGARIHWRAPEPLAGELPADALDLTGELPKARVVLLLRKASDEREYTVPARSEVVLLAAPIAAEAKRPVLIAIGRIDPRTAAAGAPLGQGEWALEVLVEIAGFGARAETAAVPVRFSRGRLRRNRPVTLTLTSEGELLTHRPIRRRIARRLPSVAEQIKRLRRRGGS